LGNSDIILSSNSSFIVFSLKSGNVCRHGSLNRLQNSHVVRVEITTRDANPPGYR